MKTLGNIIWVLFGGLEIAFQYFVGGLALMITIVGIPFGLQCMKLGVLALWPFGSHVRQAGQPTGCLSMLMNVVWFFVGGVWIVLSHVLFGALFYITIVGIPFGQMHFRLAQLALSPFGKEVV